MVISKLVSFFSPSRQSQEASALYIALVQQSRNPFFYTDCKVPDTLDGRFDMTVLFIFLGLRQLKLENNEEMQRLLLECLFADMDRSLREMGVGDMGVHKRVKKMAEAAHGRLVAYLAAWESDEQLADAIKRNIYRGEPVDASLIAAMITQMREFTLSV